MVWECRISLCSLPSYVFTTHPGSGNRSLWTFVKRVLNCFLLPLHFKLLNCHFSIRPSKRHSSWELRLRHKEKGESFCGIWLKAPCSRRISSCTGGDKPRGSGGVVTKERVHCCGGSMAARVIPLLFICGRRQATYGFWVVKDLICSFFSRVVSHCYAEYETLKWLKR